MEIQTSETIETLDKKEKDWQELRAELEEYKAIARERDESKKKHNELQITFKEEEIKHLKELYMAMVGQISPEVLATMNSDESKDAPSRTETQELCIAREPVDPPQTSQSASSYRTTIPEPSDTYMAPQFQESFNQIAKAAMNEINRTSGRTLGSAVTSQRTDRSSSNSERTSRAIVPAGPTRGEAALRSRVVDIRKHLAVRSFLLQVAAEHPRTCLIPSGSLHLIVGDRLGRDLNEIFVSGKTTVVSFGGVSVAQVIKMMESQNEDQLDTLIVMLGTNDISRAPVTPESRWEPLVVGLLNELKEK